MSAGMKWPKTLDACNGLKVRTRHAMTNSYVSVPAGATGTLETRSRWDKLRFVGLPCKCCGVAPAISGLSKEDLELLPTLPL